MKIEELTFGVQMKMLWLFKLIEFTMSESQGREPTTLLDNRTSYERFRGESTL